MAQDGKTDPTEKLLGWWTRGATFVLAAAAAIFTSEDPRRGVVLFFAILLGFLPFTYARRRLHRAIRLAAHEPARARLLSWSWLAIGVCCDLIMVLQMLQARTAEPSYLLNASALSWLGPVWFSGHAILLIGYGLLGLARRGRRLIGRVLARPVPTAGAETFAAATRPDPSRRAFLRQASALSVGVPFGVSLSGVGISYDFRVEHREIELPDLPRELDGLRVAHLSDIHVGGAMNRERLTRVAELTNEARPDLVLHTGDFLTHRAGDFDLPLYEALARVKVPLGQWACLGNHDYDNAPRFVRRLNDAGVTALRNRSTELSIDGEQLQIVGLEYVSPREDREGIYARVLGGMEEQREGARLLLNHDPQAFSDLQPGSADLVLSGHTHGGHIGVQLGADRAVSLVGMVGLRDQGVFARGDMKLYVTRCVGFYGYPMRIGIPPEIALLTLRRKA